MNADARFWDERRTGNLVDESVSALAGLALTAALFWGMSHFQSPDAPPPPRASFQDLRAYAPPLDLPPPPPDQEMQPMVEQTTPLGIDVQAEESPVQVASPPVILEPVPIPVAPPAKIVSAPPAAEFRPKVTLGATSQYIYQESEVDRRVSVISRPNPYIPPVVRLGARELRVVLLMVVNPDGRADNIRIMNSSGNAEFDKIIIQSVLDEWIFAPAIKSGYKVRCFVKEPVLVRWAGSPFEG